MNRLLVFIAFILYTWNQTAFSQDSILVNYLVKRIAAQQVKQNDFFIRGVFPSYISRKEKFSTRKKDNNIFYNGLIGYTLKKIKPELSQTNQLIVDSINKITSATYPYFINSKGRNTYNFWRTDSSYKFPYTWWIHILRGNASLPDDMDDSVLGLLAQDADDSSAKQLHELMQHYTNSDTANQKSIDEKYRSYAAYSTWFGKKFPVVFDVCVLSNILCFVQEYNLQWTKADSASLQLIIATIQNNDYKKQPLFIAPYYGKTSIILYHVSRLMSIKEIAELEDLKPQLIEEARLQFNSTGNLMEKIILSTALLRWKKTPPPDIDLNQQTIKDAEQNDLPFFIGNIPSYFNYKLKKYFTRNGIGLFYHFCPAYSDVLLLEYLVLESKKVKVKCDGGK